MPIYSTPDKFSDVIRIAVDNLTQCEQDSNYKIDMQYWHSHINGLTYVCLAGAFMAKTLQIPITSLVFNPSNLSHQISSQLYALNQLRQGFIKKVYRTLNIKGYLIKDREIHPYHLNPEKFKLEMLKLADEFEALGY